MRKSLQKSSGFRKVLQQYKEWQLVDRDDVQIVLQKKVDDISPLLKRAVILECQRKGYRKECTESEMRILLSN